MVVGMNSVPGPSRLSNPFGNIFPRCCCRLVRRRKSVQKSEMMSDSYFMFKDNNNWISAASKSVITRLASSLVKVVPSAAHSEAGGRSKCLSSEKSAHLGGNPLHLQF